MSSKYNDKRYADSKRVGGVGQISHKKRGLDANKVDDNKPVESKGGLSYGLGRVYGAASHMKHDIDRGLAERRDQKIKRMEREIPIREKEIALREREARLNEKKAKLRGSQYSGGLLNTTMRNLETAFGSNQPKNQRNTGNMEPFEPTIPDPLSNDPYGKNYARPAANKNKNRRGKGGNGKDIHIHIGK